MANQNPSGGRTVVSSGLNLWLPLKDPNKMPELLFALQQHRSKLDKYLSELNLVHYARFVPAPLAVRDPADPAAPPKSQGRGVALQVITVFDGDFDAYIMDFAMTIGDQFNLILGYVDQWPVDATGAPLRVQNHPALFLNFIKARDLGYFELGQGPIRQFGAYPQQTVIQLIGGDGMAADPAPPATPPAAVNRADVQANVLRGVGAPHAWHALLRIGKPADAGALLARLRDPASGLPQLSDDRDWNTRPSHWLTLGISYRGLLKLGIAAADAQAFREAHPEFARGPDDYATALSVGDVGASDPAQWTVGGNHPVDLMISLHADTPAVRAAESARLAAAFAAHGLTLVAEQETDLLQDQREHFGYVDMVAQPRLHIEGDKGGPPALAPDAQAGEFLLGAGYVNSYGGTGSLGGLSPALAENGIFAALRVLEQDVEAFDAVLESGAKLSGQTRGWVAGKLMGRDLDGKPLSPCPAGHAKADWELNEFDYMPSAAHPGIANDSAGLHCPVGAHARRMNPRNARVAGKAHSRRLIRRGMPYGPAWDPAKPTKAGRGLFGLFLCADLQRQYEFLLREWAQGDTFTAGISGEQDPILGARRQLRPGRPMGKSFSIPMPGAAAPLALELPRLVRTRGSAYFFMPGIAGVAHLAALAQANPAPAPLPPVAVPASVDDIARFDPAAPAVRADPFAAYAWFRDKAPVVRLPRAADSVWVFGAAELDQIARDQQNFHKRENDPRLDLPKGLLTMDAPAHAPCRAAMDGLFQQHLPGAAQIQEAVQQLYARDCAGRQVDWMADFARPLTEQLLMGMLGIDPARADGVMALVRRMLASAAPNDDINQRRLIKGLQSRLAEELTELINTGAFGHGLILKVMGTMQAGPGRPFDPVSNQPTNGAPALAVERLTNAATLFMTGILPVEWFIGLATWRLLADNGALLAQIRSKPEISDATVVAELLRYDMSAPMSNRFAVNSVTVGGASYPAGTRFMLVWASANRDAAVYGANADRIDFCRTPGDHGWAFGAPDANGARHEHNCLGRDLTYAIMEPVVALLRGADVAPALADPGFTPAWSAGAMFRAMAELPVRC